jgi:hypothetical protein
MNDICLKENNMIKSLLMASACGGIIALTGAHNAMAQAANSQQTPQQQHHHNHAGHAFAPIGVMGDHPHKTGEWMASYRYSSMQMQGNRDGTNRLSTNEVLNDFMVAPTKMTMQMHMFGLMYGLNDKLTLMGMLPYNVISMDHINRMGVEFTTKAKGIGDAKLSGLYTLYQHENSRFLLNAGISLPTGSIDERDDTPAGSNQKLPYPMQLGSGTYDLLPGVTYSNAQGKFSWGSQASAVIRLGKNSNHYRLGDQYNIHVWGARKLREYATASLRLEGKSWGNIDGEDPDLNPAMVPTARTDLRGGQRVDLLLGIDLIVPQGKLAGNRLAIEAGLPLYQNLDGPQLETDYRLTIGWQLAF